MPLTTARNRVLGQTQGDSAPHLHDFGEDG